MTHTVPEMLRQRIVGIACGYEDTTAAARLDGDPVNAVVYWYFPVARARQERRSIHG